MKRATQITEKTEVDYETGEISKTETSKVYNLPSEPPFVKLYLDDISKLYQLPKGAPSLILSLLRKMNFDGVVTLTPRSRKEIAKSLGLTPRSFNNSMSRLKKEDVFKPLGQNEYMFNPKIFAKGDWNTIRTKRNSYLELKIIYNQDGTREIGTNLIDATQPR